MGAGVEESGGEGGESWNLGGIRNQTVTAGVRTIDEDGAYVSGTPYR